MLVSKRGLDLPDVGAHFLEHNLRHSTYCVGLQVRRGVVIEPRLMSLVSQRNHRRDHVARSAVIVMLEGRALLRAGGEDLLLEPGEVSTQHTRGWSLRNLGDSTILMVEWEPGLLSSRRASTSPPAPLSPTSFRRLLKVADPLIGPKLSPRAAAHCASEVIGLLAIEGLPLARVPAGDLMEELPNWAPLLNHQVDQAISSLSQQPMLVDLERELGWSERRIQRRLNELHQRNSQPLNGGWRDLVHGWRILAGVGLMSMPHMTTEQAASLAGYGSPIAFCRAFANAGLPAPGEVRKALRSLT